MNKESREALERYQQRLELIKSNSTLKLYESRHERLANIERAKKDIDYCVKRYFSHLATCDNARFQINFANKVKRNPKIRAFAQWGRGLAKSIWCDVFIPFWLHIDGKANYVVLVGSTYDAAKDLLGDIQAEFEVNARLINDFGEQKTQGFWTEGAFRTQSGFLGKGLGLGQKVRGLRIGAERPQLVIGDDWSDKRTVKNPQAQDEIVEWTEGALLKTMDGSPRRFLYAGNKFAPRMVQIELQKRHPKWYVSNVPAYDKKTYKPIWDAKYDDDYYKDIEEEDGVLSARSEYLNEPHLVGKLFKNKHLIWRKRPRISLFTRFVCHWDIAWTDNETSDYNAMEFMGVVKDGSFGKLYGYCRQVEIEEALIWLAQLIKRLPKTMVEKLENQYERQFINKEIKRTIKKVEKEYKVKFNFIEVSTPKVAKYERLLGLYPYYQNKRVWSCDTLKSDNDHTTGFEQLKGIEPGYKTKDDSPDAQREAIRRLEQYIYEDDAPPPTTGTVESKNTI